MVVSNPSQHGSGFCGEPWDKDFILRQGAEPRWIFNIFYILLPYEFFNIYGNSDCRSLVFTEIILKTLADGLRVHTLRSREVSYQNVLMQLSCEYDYQLRREGLTTSSAKRQVKRRSTSSQQFFKTITSQLLIKIYRFIMVHITIQPIIYHDLIFANLDLESKAGQYPEPTFLTEVIGT